MDSQRLLDHWKIPIVQYTECLYYMPWITISADYHQTNDRHCLNDFVPVAIACKMLIISLEHTRILPTICGINQTLK